jgi:hypothetical protein
VPSIYDGAARAMIAVFRSNRAVQPGLDAFRRYLLRALALGAVPSYFQRWKYDAICTVAALPCSRWTVPNHAVEHVIAAERHDHVTRFPHLRPQVCATLACVRALGPDNSLKEHPRTRSSDPDKWKCERGRRPILNPNAVAQEIGIDRALSALPLGLQSLFFWTWFRLEVPPDRQNYWSRDPQVQSEWGGRVAHERGLRGSISAEDFARLSEGQHPVSGARFVKHQPQRTYENEYGRQITSVEHRAGWDATFSASNSVSLTGLLGAMNVCAWPIAKASASSPAN